MIARLFLMMFLEFAVLGAWCPVLGPYLKAIGVDDPWHVGWIFATMAFASILAPIPWSQVADRWLAMERCIALCCAVAGTILWFLPDAQSPRAVFWVSFAHWLFMIPTLSLTPPLVFRHLAHPESTYGFIRMGGTLGWMAAGWGLTIWYRWLDAGPDHDWADAPRWGALLAWVAAVYALTLPSTPPLRGADPGASLFRRAFDAPLQALVLFRHPAFVVYVICFFGLYVSWPFNLQMTALLVKSLGVDPDWLPTLMTLAQTTEALTLGTLPFWLTRFGHKRTMIVGIFSWSFALVALAVGRPAWLVLASLPLHGFYITCFLVAGQVFVNRIAEHEYRASAQGLLMWINGTGLLAGSFLSAYMCRMFANDYSRTFAAPAVWVTLLAVFFVFGFRLPPVNTDQTK